MIQKFSSLLPQFCHLSLQLFKYTICWHVQISTILWFLNQIETSSPFPYRGWFLLLVHVIFFYHLDLCSPPESSNRKPHNCGFFSSVVWMTRKEANGMSEPHLKFCLYKLKKKLRLELHRRYSGTSETWDFGKSYSQSCKNLFWPFLTIFCLFLQTKRKAHKVKSWSRKPYDTIQCFSGLGCEP